MPKAFRGHNGIIQRNAIQSWMRLCPSCEIILLGDDEGTAEVAAELGTRHAPDIARSDYGTPLISSIYSTAQQLASYELVCHINADIILMSDFLPAIEQIRQKSYLLVGQRWDLDVTEPLDFTQPDWETQLRSSLAEGGKLHNKSGIDYFVFPRGFFDYVPAFAIGRGAWDNWLIYRARALKAPVIDATKAITIIHQNHDYLHIKQKNSSPQPAGTVADPKKPERERNVALAGRADNFFTLEFATLILTPEGLRAALTPRHLYFRMRAVPVLHPSLHFLLPLFKTFEKCVRITRSGINKLRR